MPNDIRDYVKGHRDGGGIGSGPYSIILERNKAYYTRGPSCLHDPKQPNRDREYERESGTVC